MKTRQTQRRLFSVCVTAITLALFFPGCATRPYLKGVTPEGEKVYVGPVPIEGADTYRSFKDMAWSEPTKITYLFKRFMANPDLVYFYNGEQFGPLLAYRGGMWLVRNRYETGQTARDFILKHAVRSEDKGQYHLIRFPDGSVHIGYFVLLNELDLLEEVIGKEVPATPPA